MDTQEQQRWRHAAACYGAPTELFFPAKGDNRQQIVEAKAYCARCPVLELCRAYALQFDAARLPGIYGGLTQSERKQQQRATA